MEYITSNVESIGISSVIDFFKKAIELYDLPIISVGSGCAALEKVLEDELNIQIICVDPDPLSYASIEEPFIYPQYPTVEDMIKVRPEYIDSCILFTCNAEPTISEEDIPYDYNAIQLLRPKILISIYDDIDGISGSSKFIQWVEDNEDKIIRSITRTIKHTHSNEYTSLILLKNE